MVRLRPFIKHHPAMLILHCWSNGWTEIAGPLLHSVSTTSSDFPNPFLESHEKELSRLFTRTPNLGLEAEFLQPRALKLLRCSISESTSFSRIWLGMNTDHQLIFIRRIFSLRGVFDVVNSYYGSISFMIFTFARQHLSIAQLIG